MKFSCPLPLTGGQVLLIKPPENFKLIEMLGLGNFFS